MLKITGTGSALPACIKSNQDLAEIVETNDEWISTRTGIRQRHLCTAETLSDLSAEAGRKALESAGVSAADLDLIICSTIRGDYITPSQACIIEERLGANCPAFDINAACSGFIYALDVAVGYFARGRAKKILIVSAEAMSNMVDWSDRSTCVLFGDGAAAVVVEPGESLLSIRLTSTGNLSVLNIPHVTGNNPFHVIEQKPSFLYMNGQEVYKFAVNALTTDMTAAIDEAGLTSDDIDWFLPHQANIRIIETARAKLGIPLDKIKTIIDRTGNNSAASIPMMIDELNRDGLLKPGMNLALCAFGGGLTTGACVLRW